MYTEDDDKVKAKNKNSNNNYSDFYTSFDQLDEKDIKKNKKTKIEKKKPVKEKTVKVEENNDDFYDLADDSDKDINKNNNDKSKKIKMLLIGGLVFLILIILIILYFVGTHVKGDIELTYDNIAIKVGESNYISYKIVDTESDVKSTFKSSDESIAVVDENGKITAVGIGETTITISYTIDGKTRKKECAVKVTGDSDINQELTISIKFNSGESDKWVSKNVEFIVEANSVFGIDKIQYGVNCDSGCDYKTINNKSKITVSNNGITTIKVVATDKKKQKAEKNITIKIDKEAPSIGFDSENITSDKDVEVCATCIDSISGCRQEKVCKKYTSSKSNQTITVFDNAGNKKESRSFNVTINKPQTVTPTPKTTNAPCSLKVSSSGTVTATLNVTATYYGFNNTLSGSNELSKTISIAAYKNGVKADVDGASGAKVIRYYVKEKNGAVGQCYITVIKECSCQGSSGSNCTVTCKYRSN